MRELQIEYMPFNDLLCQVVSFRTKQKQFGSLISSTCESLLLFEFVKDIRFGQAN